MHLIFHTTHWIHTPRFLWTDSMSWCKLRVDRRNANGRDRIIVDAAIRRFQCQRSYLRAHAGMRWMDSRSKILRGQSPNASHLAALQAADNNLRMVRLSHLHDTPYQSGFHPRSVSYSHDPPGTPCHHRCPRRLHTAQRGHATGEMARRRPLPDSNPADAHEPIILTLPRRAPALLRPPIFLQP